MRWCGRTDHTVGRTLFFSVLAEVAIAFCRKELRQLGDHLHNRSADFHSKESKEIEDGHLWIEISTVIEVLLSDFLSFIFPRFLLLGGIVMSWDEVKDLGFDVNQIVVGLQLGWWDRIVKIEVN